MNANSRGKQNPEKKKLRKPLRKMRDDPTNKVRVMQINSATTIPFVPVTTGTSGTRSSSPATATAQSPLQLTSPTFSSMVEEAKSYPEVRSEVVAAYKAQVASGHYPPAVVISGLADLLSGGSSD